MKLQNLDIIVTYRRRWILGDHVARNIDVYLGEGITTGGPLSLNRRDINYIIRRVSIGEEQELLIRKYLIDETAPKNLLKKLNFISDIFRRANTPLTENRGEINLPDITMSNYVSVMRLK